MSIPHRDWARLAAALLRDKLKDAAALDTADYRLCAFIEAAANLALEDPAVAALIGQRMEVER